MTPCGRPTAAAVLVAELGDVRRFTHPRHVMAFLGLVPHEHTTGTSRKLGGITKAGNAHARWILTEAVQHAFLVPKVSSQLTVRQRGHPGHLGVERGLIDKDQTPLIPTWLVAAPPPPGCGNIRSILLGGVRRFFYSSGPVG